METKIFNITNNQERVKRKLPNESLKTIAPNPD